MTLNVQAATRSTRLRLVVNGRTTMPSRSFFVPSYFASASFLSRDSCVCVKFPAALDNARLGNAEDLAKCVEWTLAEVLAIGLVEQVERAQLRTSPNPLGFSECRGQRSHPAARRSDAFAKASSIMYLRAMSQ